MDSKDKSQKKKKVVKIEGMEIHKCGDGFLSSKLGTYRAAIGFARIAGVAFFLFFLIFGAMGGDPLLLLMCGGAGLLMGLLFWSLSFPLVSKVKAINQELEKRTKKDKAKQEILAETAKQSGNRYKLIAILAVPVGVIIALIFLLFLNGGDKKDGCVVCGERAGHSFSDNNYCEKHYAEAIVGTMDKLSEKDD